MGIMGNVKPTGFSKVLRESILDIDQLLATASSMFMSFGKGTAIT